MPLVQKSTERAQRCMPGRIRCELSKKVSDQLRFHGWSCQRQSHRRVRVPGQALLERAVSFLREIGRQILAVRQNPFFYQTTTRKVRAREWRLSSVCDPVSRDGRGRQDRTRSLWTSLREVLAPLSMTNCGRGRRRGEPRLYGGAGTVIRSASSCNPLAERGLSENQLRACRRQSDFLLLRSRGLRSHRLCIRPRRRAS